MMHSRWLRVLVSGVTVLSLGVLVGSQAFAAQYTIRFSSFFGTTHPATHSMEAFKASLEKASGGQIEVQLYPANQLCGEEQAMDLIRSGTVQVALVGGLMKRDEPRVAAMEAPFVINSWAQARKVYQGRGGEILAGNYTRNTGVYIKGWFVNGFRQISSTFPVESMADMTRMKIRSPINDVFVRTFKALGAKTLIIPLTELYASLENNVVDGQDTPYSTVRANNLFDVQGHILESRHMFSATAVLVNGNFFDSLPPDLQKAFDDCMKHTVELNWDLSEQDEEASRRVLQEKGMKIHVPGPELRQQMQNAVKPMYDWFYAEIPDSREFIEYCRSME